MKAGIGDGDDEPHFLALVKAGDEEMTPQTMMITGVAVSVPIQLILRYTKRPSYEGLILFLILIFLSAAGWVVGFAIGGWNGVQCPCHDGDNGIHGRACDIVHMVFIGERMMKTSFFFHIFG
ncbi:hypothetical protein [Rossellomorea marisflavi]|uniref:hypothetical protein n=1 Tax=Rossellomorea marisflavi TaxID=189381 RepID=UPI001EE38150|nr:hypothetical protein [Rossellomorea marisflavi]UKS66022.1 hypothetical protein K6T23_03885 [Rossellomorea marisflavi]